LIVNKFSVGDYVVDIYYFAKFKLDWIRGFISAHVVTLRCLG